MSNRWEPNTKHQKQYPHFDAPLPLKELADIANEPKRVEANSFFPFLQFKRSWVPFRADGYRDPKERLIRFASRRDSAIFSRYRALLSDLYEAHLKTAGVDDAVIAYRRIPLSPGSPRGKCNIHFAKETFESIQSLGTCCAVVMDISKYFENIDHQQLKSCWAQLRQRQHDDDTSASEYVRKLVDLPEGFEVPVVIAIGYAGEKKPGHPFSSLQQEKIRRI